jgi:ATP-binding cassette subfamily B protein
MRVVFWLPCLVVVLALPLAVVRRRDARARVQWQERYAGDQRDIGYAGAVLTGRATAKDVRVLRLLPFWRERLVRLRAGLRASLRALAGRRGTAELLVQAFASAGLFVAYYVLARASLAGDLSLGALVLQAQAAQRAQNGVRDLLAALAGLHEHRLFLRPVIEFLALQPRLVAPPPRTPPPGPLALAVHELAFRYPEGAADVLHELTFAIGAGERVAIVGRNGSGKSTLLKLLARLYAPARGHVLGNGEGLAHVEPEHWFARVAVLLQDASLFELTLRENLTLGHTVAASDGALWQVLEVVGLAARVRELPAGLDTFCSRRHAGGVDWSVGEARRLLLARALAQRADLVLLDEPLLALDGALAESLGRHLAGLPRDRTLVLADHRPQAIAWVDRVFVLDGGRLVAHGTPAALRAQPAFAALFPG